MNLSLLFFIGCFIFVLYLFIIVVYETKITKNLPTADFRFITILSEYDKPYPDDYYDNGYPKEIRK